MSFFERLRRRISPEVPTDKYEPILLVPIGIVHSSLQDLRYQDTSRQRATIELLERFAPALLGLDGFSHAIVLSWLDRVSDEERRILRKQTGGEPLPSEIGVFALRTHHRPNPIAVSVVRIERVEGPSVDVVGLDVIDGTPVLDIKPYLPRFDSPPDAGLPSWAVRGVGGRDP